jgi:hypothetical protein
MVTSLDSVVPLALGQWKYLRFVLHKKDLCCQLRELSDDKSIQIPCHVPRWQTVYATHQNKGQVVLYKWWQYVIWASNGTFFYILFIHTPLPWICNISNIYCPARDICSCHNGHKYYSAFLLLGTQWSLCA